MSGICGPCRRGDHGRCFPLLSYPLTRRECQCAARGHRPPVTPGPANCGCSLCGHVFGTLTDFDSHLIRRYSQSPALSCRDPASLGLVRDPRGIWRTPAGEANRKRLADRLRARASHGDGPYRPSSPLGQPEPGPVIARLAAAWPDMTAGELFRLARDARLGDPGARELLGLPSPPMGDS